VAHVQAVALGMLSSTKGAAPPRTTLETFHGA